MKYILRVLASLILATAVASFYGGALPSIAQKDEIRQRIFVHYPKEKGDNHTGTDCNPTVDDSRVTYGLTGWSMPAAGVTYKVNSSTVPTSIRKNINTILANATGTWNAADPDQKFTNGGSTKLRVAKFDGTNVIAWGATPSGAIGVTYVWYNITSGQLVETDMIFNRNYSWSWTPTTGDCVALHSYDAQNIATHEFGHVVGLEDLYDAADRDLTMYGYGALGETKKDSLGAGDNLGVNAVAP